MIAKRRNNERNAALLQPIDDAEGNFACSFGFSRGGADRWKAAITNPRDTVCLRATDYFLRALQRFSEPREHSTTREAIHEDRYLNAIRPQVSQIHGLHFGPTQGNFLTTRNPLTTETRFGPKIRKKKIPQV